jgi:hypothetical protein
MNQTALLEFKSSAFPAEIGEDEHTNVGIVGEALARWLAEQLRVSGVDVGEVIAEDFGWCIPIESKSHALFVACASAEEESGRWRVFAFAEGGLMERLLRRDQRNQVLTSLLAKLKAILQASDLIQDLIEAES